MKTLYRVLLGALALLLIFGVLVYWKYPEQVTKRIRMDYEVESPEEELLKYETQILADRALLEKYEIFRGSRGEKDAGPMLNPMVNWERESGGALTLPKEVKEKLNDKDWVAYAPDFKALGLDFSWMAKLHDFDHWALHENNARVDRSQKPSLMEIPFPNYRELTHWAKLRLIHGRLTQTLPQALRDVRHLVRLIFTNDSLISSVVAQGILGVEGQFVQSVNPKIVGGWKTIPQDVLQTAKRYFWAQPTFVDPRLSNETYERFSGGDVGKCQMVSEGNLPNLIVRDHLRMTYPGPLRRFDGTVKNSLTICRKSLAHEAWLDPSWKVFGKGSPFEDALLKAENESDWKRKILAIHPRAEDIFGFIMLRDSTPNYLKYYGELPPKKE